MINILVSRFHGLLHQFQSFMKWLRMMSKYTNSRVVQKQWMSFFIFCSTAFLFQKSKSNLCALEPEKWWYYMMILYLQCLNFHGVARFTKENTDQRSWEENYTFWSESTPLGAANHKICSLEGRKLSRGNRHQWRRHPECNQTILHSNTHPGMHS